MFEDMTPEKIRKRILARLETSLQTREGSFTNDIIAAAAAELSECYHSLDALVPAFYVDETSGPYIDKQAATVGIFRKAGTEAECTLLLTGAEGAQVPAGTPFYTAAGLAFYLKEAVTVREGSGQGLLAAAGPGEAYNIAAGEIVSTLRNYPGISGYENRAAAGGTDPETDAALLGRYLERMRRPATSGNPWHYQQWAKEVDGVGAARVIGKWDGPGTVKVILADQEMRPASAAAAGACAAHIEAERPVGPAVTVEPAGEVEISLSAEVVTDGSLDPESAGAALGEALAAYFRRLAASAFGGSVDAELDGPGAGAYTVLYSRAVFLLLSIPGVVDYRALTLNGGMGNVAIPAGAVPVLGEVAVS